MSDDAFQQLPDWAKEKLSISNTRKEWKKCAACHVDSKERPLKACSGCVHRPQPVFYCSKECQKSNWRVHKMDCELKSVAVPEARFLAPRSDPFVEKTLKQIERWHAVYQNLVVWCITQIYHFNTAIDPETCFINIELHPNTFQIRCVTIQPKDGESAFKLSSPLAPYPHFYQINVLPNTPYQCGSVYLGSTKDLYSLESRAKIRGCKQWFYIATHITSRVHSSKTIATMEYSALWAAIEYQVEHCGVSFDEYEFTPQRLAHGPIITPFKMCVWHLKLSQLDLWTALDAGGQLRTILG